MWSGTCALNGRIVAGPGFASSCVCPGAIEGSKSKVASRSLLYRQILPYALSDTVSIAFSPFHRQTRTSSQTLTQGNPRGKKLGCGRCSGRDRQTSTDCHNCEHSC